MKTCTRCNETKPVTSFSRKVQAPDGLQPRCKVCNMVDEVEYRIRMLNRLKNVNEKNKKR